MNYFTQNTLTFTFVEMADALITIAAEKRKIVVPNNYTFSVHEDNKTVKFCWVKKVVEENK